MSTSRKVAAISLVIVFALASVASAKVLFARSYVGQTSQGMAVSLKLPKSRKSAQVTLKILYMCPALQAAFSTTDSFKVAVSKRGKFRDAWDDNGDFPDDPSVGSGDLTVRISGSESGALAPKRAKGRYHSHATIVNGDGGTVDECDTGTITYTARATK